MGLQPKADERLGRRADLPEGKKNIKIQEGFLWTRTKLYFSIWELLVPCQKYVANFKDVTQLSIALVATRKYTKEDRDVNKNIFPR